jgi:IS30 family transposase
VTWDNHDFSKPASKKESRLKYLQITSADRHTISDLRKKGYKPRKIAEMLGRHPSTVYREIERNSAAYDFAYRPFVAIQRTSGRRSRSRRNQQFTGEEIGVVVALLKQWWSPEQISAWLGAFGVLSISHMTIYRYVRTDKRFGGVLYKNLRHSKKHRKGYRTKDSRGRLLGKRHISERPESVENRDDFGHWEIDTVMGTGNTHCIVTLVERKSKCTLIGKLKARSTKETNARTEKLMKQYPGLFKSITADNGTEFHAYKKLEKKTGVVFYFATPYHSWERGLSENTNGLIRQYLPKGTSMA